MIAAWQREILLAQVAAAWFMAGLIWFVQLVHYPLMSRVGAAEWRAYEREHQRRTTWIVAPMMLIELLTAAMLIFAVVSGAAAYSATEELVIWVASALLAVAWLSTFAVQVRLHTQLLDSDDAAIRRRLVSSNWLRTFAWTARAVLLLLLLR